MGGTLIVVLVLAVFVLIVISKTAIVVPKGDATLSPLELWEAIEKAGKVPVKLEGPSGTFTSKPKK